MEEETHLSPFVLKRRLGKTEIPGKTEEIHAMLLGKRDLNSQEFWL